MSVSRSSFPTEIVRQILVGCLLDPEFYTNPFDLARVCRQWRGVIDAENSLWETLHITWIAGPNMRYYLLHPCTRIAPLAAQDRGTPRAFLERAQNWLARSKNIGAKISLSLETDGTEPEALLPTLFTQYSNRLRQLSLTAPLSTLVRLLRCIQKLQGEKLTGEFLLPHLEVFEIHVAYCSAPGTTLRGLKIFDLSRWTALKHVKIRGSKPGRNRQGLLNCRIVSGIPFKQLASLYLEDRKLTVLGVRNILDKCDRLEVFSALVEQEIENIELLPFNPTTLPNLRIMHLHFLSNSNACGFVARFFSGLWTPALKELAIDAQYAIDESKRFASMLSHMLLPTDNSHPIEALTLSVDLTIDSVISTLKNLPKLRYLRLCAPVRGGPAETYLRCGYLQILEMMTQPHNEHDFPFLEEIFIEDNVPSEIHDGTSLLLEDGNVDPGAARHLGLAVIQSLVESRCKSDMHIRSISVTWKNVGRDWPSVELDTGEYNYPYNHPTLKVRENSMDIVVKCLPHRQNGSEAC